ncbi:hypothetical protein B9Z65_8038 [Elsinoe australis]|uniref:Uncharacterized protein n=1 Tax=Elsinoe australis TaxID=40998 RepID=A0A2P7YVV6_9PEZI|nr:hypothetical protein B9Z65_8038 [Elsinoe australis]
MEQGFLHGVEAYADFGAPEQLTKPGQTKTNNSSSNDQNTSHTTNSPTTSSPIKTTSFNPAQLLNPKVAQHRSQHDPYLKDTQQNDPSEDNYQGNGYGYGNLLERMHGVERRGPGPLKRLRADEDYQDDDEDSLRKKSKFTGAGKGGIIGESVREMRQEAQEKDGPGPLIMDLTNDDDDDYITFTGSRPVTTRKDEDLKREVCIGMFPAKIHADRVPYVNKSLTSTTTWGTSKLAIKRTPGQPRMLGVYDKMDQRFGNIELRVAIPLSNLMSNQTTSKLRLTTILLPRNRKKSEQEGDNMSDLLECHITLFCARSFVEVIGRQLSQQKLFLSDPIGREIKEIINPHKPKDHRPRTTTHAALLGTSAGVGTGTASSVINRTAEDIKRDIDFVINNLPNAPGLPMTDTNVSLVKTGLMDHQKQALFWLSSMETPYGVKNHNGTGLWKPDDTKGERGSWYNTISGHEVKSLPECFGGLFSDDMGLGKTLSILSRVALTYEESIAFGATPLSKEMQKHEMVESNSRGTLIVCPTGVLSNWDEQIKTHLDTTKIKYYRYHGSTRTQDLEDLASYDIVLTSYGTCSNELTRVNSRMNALARLNWFRLVLDEAHSIKNMQTGWFKGCTAISSPRRWAVTGTPIQNRLDDLGALVKFIKLAPFHEKANWEQYILAPFKSGNENALDNLKALVGSIMLRRSKKTINLPPAVTRTIELDMSSEERSIYELFVKDAGVKVNALVRDERLRGKGTAHMLTFITRLRLICCHGRELLSEADLKITEGRTAEDAIDLGGEDDMDKPVLNDYEIYTTFDLLRSSDFNQCAFCPNDSRINVDDLEVAAAPANGSDSDEEPNDTFAYFTSCAHLLCPKHVDKWFASCPPRTSDNHCLCPICSSYIRNVLSPITRSSIEAEDERREELRSNPKKVRESTKYGGPHTKVKALISRLKKNIKDSAALPPSEPPIRSIVFSGWTQYLDLMGIGLNDAEIPYLRLDGSMHATKRARVIEQFRTDPTYTVMLVSIRAGGQGLNFTAANKVYMMEPQFNPGVENQAVDRVHRLGQNREVEIVKFVMRNSFEGKIIKLQEQKMALAREAFGEGGKGGVKERLEGLRSLFK